LTFLPLLGAGAELVKRGLDLLELAVHLGFSGIAGHDNRRGNEYRGAAEGQREFGLVPASVEGVTVAHCGVEA